jgi:predicted MFS family arabinose efflux permease
VTSPFLLQWQDLQTVLWIQALFSLIAVSVFLVAMRVPPQFADESLSPISIRAVWSHKWVKQYSFLLFLGFGLFVTLTTWLEVLSTPIGFSGEQVGLALGGMTLAGIVGAALIPDWSVRGFRGRGVLCASLAVSVLMLVSLASSVPFWLFLSLLALSGCLLLANLPIILSSAEDKVSPGAVGTVTAVLLLFGNLGGIVLTLCTQLMLDNRILAILFLTLVVIITVPVALKFPSLSAIEGSGGHTVSL